MYLRFCNEKLQDEKWPLPNIREILDSLAGAKYFSHLDLSQGYNQIELNKASRPITAFTVGSCFVYLDDLIVFGNNLTNHNINLIKVLQRLREVNLKLNPNKCEFLKKELLYVGHIAKGVLPDPGKILAVQNYPEPTNADKIKRFLAFANYYRKYIKNFAEIAAPLNNL